MSCRRLRFGLFPTQPLLLGSLDRAVTEALRLVSGQHELHRGEEVLDELLLLAVPVLPDALRYGDRGPLELQDGEGDTVHVEHDVRPLVPLPGDRDFLGDGEVVAAGVLPVDQPDRLVVLADFRPDLYSVPEEVVDLAVRFVERPGTGALGGPADFLERFPREPVSHVSIREPGA